MSRHQNSTSAPPVASQAGASERLVASHQLQGLRWGVRQTFSSPCLRESGKKRSTLRRSVAVKLVLADDCPTSAVVNGHAPASLSGARARPAPHQARQSPSNPT